MKKLFKRGIAILLCFTMVFNYSFSVLADENVESSEPETTYTETIETTEIIKTTESVEEEIGEEIEEEASDDSSEEIIEPEDDNEDIEDAYEEEPEVTLGDTFDEPKEDDENIDNTELENDLKNNDIAVNEIGEDIEEINAEEESIKESEIEDIEEASPSEAEEEIENETKIEEDVEESTPSDIDEILDDIEEATPSEIVDTPTDYFIREKVVDNIKITLTADKGVFPENAELFVEKVEDEHTKEAIEEAIEEVVEKECDNNVNVATSYKFDIKMILNGEEIQPDTSKGSVKVSFTFNEKINDCFTGNVYHLKEEADGEFTVENLETLVKAAEEVSVEIDGFSYYVVEFTSNELQSVSPSNNSIMFSSGMTTEIPFDPKNWMSKLPSNYPITELTVPASHDSGTYNIKFYGLELLKIEIIKIINNGLGRNIGEYIFKYLQEHFSVLTKLLDNMATWVIETIQKVSGQCQTDSITEQLNKGIRALDLRFRYENGEFYIVHGCESEGLIGILTTCNCYDKNNNRLTLDMCFSEIRDFLNEHTSEVVFISVQQEGGDYNREIEKKIIQLEFNYGIELHFAKREYSESVIQELYPTTPNNRNINAKNISERGIHELGQFRQKAVDITDAVEDWENHWSDTVDMKKNHLNGAVKDHSLLGMAQSNVMVKIYKKNDPHNECSFPFSIKIVRIPVIRIPLYITIDFHAEKLIITPKAQAAKVKPHLMNLIKNYTNSGKSSDKALGLVRLDFPSASESAIIANVNTKNTYFPETGALDTSDYSFVYDGMADYETEAEEFLEEAEREVEELSVYDYRFYIDNNNSGGGGSSGSSGGTPRYDFLGNIIGPGGIMSNTYDGTNPPNLTGNINVSSWNYATGTPQANSVKYVQNTDSFVRSDNTPVVTEWVGITTNEISKVMWYRTDATGKILKNQFIQIGTNIYYLDNNGIMVTGQHTINGKVYNFETTVGGTEGKLLY